MASASAAKPKRAKIDFEMLYRQNCILAVLYLLEAAAILVAATSKAFPLSANFLGLDTLSTGATGKAVLAPATHHAFDVRLVWVLIAMLLASSLAYVLIASRFREYYERNLAKLANPIRWILHGVSAGLGVAALGALLGVYDILAILMLFVLSLGGYGLYALAELLRPKMQPFGTRVFWIGTAASLVAWFVLAATAWNAHVYGAGVSPYLHFLYPVMLILAAFVSANFYLQLGAKGKWADYLYGERIFMITNFVAQAVLVWAIFAGSLRP